MRRAVAAGVMVAVMFLASCGGGGGSEPVRLRIAFSVTDEEMLADRVAVYGAVAAYLGSRVGAVVEPVRTTGYGVNIEALRAGKVDICSFSPFPYLIARQKGVATPLVTLARKDGSPATYRSVFITHPESGLLSMEDVKARAGQVTLAFANPASTSGHLVPRAHLQEMGLVPERDFRRVVFSENHVVSLMNVRSGKLELAAVTQSLLRRMQERGDLKPEELRVLWTSPDLVQGVVVVRADLPEAQREALRAAYLAMAQERPDLIAELTKLMVDRDVVYVAAGDELFEPYRRMALSVEQLRLVE